MFPRIPVFFALVSGIVAIASASAAEIRVGGGAAPIENIFKKIKPAFEQSSGLKLVLSSDGPDKAFMDLEAGKLDIAAAGLSMSAWLELMEKKGHPIANAKDYKARVVGRDKITVLANKSVESVKSLSKDQLKGIFTGAITNWKEVGGPSQAIVLVFGTKIPGTNKVWQETIMDKEAWAKGMKEVGDTVEIEKAIVATPGAVGIGPLASDARVYSPQTPEVGRPITAITKGAPSENAMKVFNFISGEGQKLISR